MAKAGKIVLDHEDAFSLTATWWKAFFLVPAWSFIFLMPLGVLLRSHAPAFFEPFFFLVVLASFVFFAYDLRRRRVIIDGDKIDFGFQRLPLAELEKITLSSYRLRMWSTPVPNGIKLHFKNGDSMWVVPGRLGIEGTKTLIDVISRRVSHCKIDTAIEQYIKRCTAPPLVALPNPDKLQINYRTPSVWDEIPGTLRRTFYAWGRYVGPIGTLILSAPLWLTFVYQMLEALRDYTTYQGNTQFYDFLIRAIEAAAPVVGTGLAAGAIFSGTLGATALAPIFASFVVLVALQVLIKNIFGANKLTIDRGEVSLDRFYELFSVSIGSARWNNVQLARLEMSENSADPGKARIVFRDKSNKKMAMIYLGALSKSDKEAVALAISNLGDCPVDADVTESLTPSQNSSYTELWLKSLSESPTRKNLEPLASGHMLASGRYEVMRRLAVGGEGITYVAADKKELRDGNVRLVVLKETLIPPYVDKDVQKSALFRFEQEARLLKNVQSEKVVELLDYFVEDHRCYLVLEYIEGHTLRQYVEENGPLEEALAIELGLQMAWMLTFLHERDVIHRDFTPENLILQKNGSLKLIDFNVAREASDGTTGTIVGKHAYVPPEQFRGKPTAQSDIYAMGATIYFLTSGRDPVPIMQSSPLGDGFTLSHDLDKLIQDCTAIDLDRRLPDAKNVRDRLREMQTRV